MICQESERMHVRTIVCFVTERRRGRGEAFSKEVNQNTDRTRRCKTAKYKEGKMKILSNFSNLTGQRESPEMKMALENIMQVDGEIQQKIFQLGQAYYEKNKNKSDEELDDEYAHFVQFIRKLEENRKGYYKNKLRLEGQMICENCGSIISYGSVFCNHCGKKADEKSENAETSVKAADAAKCSQCGGILEEGSLFCTSCGAKAK